MIERSGGYPALQVFPSTGPQPGPVRPIDTTTRTVLVTLAGTDFVAEVQVSNAQSSGPQPHLFTPPDNTFDTFKTLTPADPPLVLPAPLRWVRVVLVSGTLTGGNIEQGSRDDTASLLPQVQVKIGELDATIAASQATVAGLVADTEQSAALALGATNIQPAYISNTTALPPVGPNGTSGTWLTADGRVYGTVQAGTWVQSNLALASVAAVARARAIAEQTITLAEFGAPSEDFDPVQAWALTGAARTAYLAAHDSSEAFQQAIQYVQASTRPIKLLLTGRRYFGPLTGARQRELGRRIYGTSSNVYALNSLPIHEAVTLTIEDCKNLTIEGQDCELYQNGTNQKLLGIWNSSSVKLTGTGRIYGNSTRADGTRNTENDALIHIGYGARGTRIGAGWYLGAFLGDGVTVGGALTDFGSTIWDAIDTVVSAEIRERYGDGIRPYAAAQGIGTVAGSSSRLCVAGITVQGLLVDSRNISGGIDYEPNIDGQHMVDAWVRDAALWSRWVLPLAGGGHPWQEEEIVAAGTPGAARIIANLTATCPQWGPIVSGGGFERISMDYGWITVDRSVVLPIRDVTFTEAGYIKIGNFSNDIGHATVRPIVERVTAPTVIPGDFYPHIPATPSPRTALITWAGNIVSAVFADNTVLDASYAAVVKLARTTHTGGNSEINTTYLQNRNLGLGAGAGTVLGHTISGGSVEIASRSSKNPSPTVPLQTLILAPTPITLNAAGKIDYLATPASSYIVTANSGGAQTFTGFTAIGDVPAGLRVILRAAAGQTITLGNNGGVTLRGNQAFALIPDGEVELIKNADNSAMREVRRSLMPSVTQGAVTATTLSVGATYSQAEVVALEARLRATTDAVNSMRVALRVQGEMV